MRRAQRVFLGVLVVFVGGSLWTLLPRRDAPSIIERSGEGRSSSATNDGLLFAARRPGSRGGAERGDGGADAARPRSADDSRSAVARAVRHATARLRSLLEATPEYAQYRACIESTPDPAIRCRLQLDNAFFAVRETFAEELAADNFDMGAVVEAWTVGEVQRQLGVEYAAAGRDDSARLATLMLCEQSPKLESCALPAGSYARLDSATDAEIQLLHHEHRATSAEEADVSAAIADQVVTPGHSDRIKYTAVEALGHPTASHDLDRVVRHLAPSALMNTLMADRVGTALAGCGVACRDTALWLAAQPNAESRQAFARWLWSQPPSSRPQWVAEAGPEVGRDQNVARSLVNEQ